MKQERASRIVWLIALPNLFGAFIPLVAQTNALVLSSPFIQGPRFIFTLTGESNVSYTIQASSNLLDWVSVATNSDPGITRNITITNKPASPSYYRAVQMFPLFEFALTAKGTISLVAGAYVDSFNSADPNHSTNGLYIKSMATSNAVVLTDSSATNAISLSSGASYIWGLADTGPGGAVILNGGYATTIRNDANVQINDMFAPSWSTNSALYSTSLPSGMVGGTNYTFVATNGNYKVFTLNVVGGQKMVVNGNVNIYLTFTENNALVVGGSGFIYILPGSSLTIYSAGNVNLSGSGLDNGNPNASTFSIYGLQTCTSVTLSANANFIGIIDAPEAAIFLSGATGWSGAGIANSFNISSSGGIHYDENLASVGPTR